jgi:hypothetical protein
MDKVDCQSWHLLNVRLGSEADIAIQRLRLPQRAATLAPLPMGFTPENGHHRNPSSCPLSANSRHLGCSVVKRGLSLRFVAGEQAAFHWQLHCRAGFIPAQTGSDIIDKCCFLVGGYLRECLPCQFRTASNHNLHKSPSRRKCCSQISSLRLHVNKPSC